MTRTALGIVVCALLCGPPCAQAQPAPTPPAGQQAAPPDSPPLSLPRKSVGILELTPPQRKQIEKSADPGKATAVDNAFRDVNEARERAEAQAQKTGGSEQEQAQAVANDPEVVAAVRAAGALVAGPDVPSSVRERVATALNTTGQHQQAAGLSEATLAREPDNRDALNNISQARFSLGQYRQAIESATRLMQKEPDSEAAYTTRALSRYYSGEYVLAAEDAQHALALNKNNDIAVAALRMAHTHIQAAPLKLDVVAAAQAEKIKAEYQASLEQRNEAEAAAARASAPPPADPLRQQTAAKIAPSDQLGAVADATRAIERDPNNAEAWYLRAAARNQTGEHEQAIQDASQALRLAPGHALAYGTRARAKFSTGRWQDAADDATRSIELDPTNAYAFAVRARAFEKLGNFAATLADLSQAARINRQFEPEYRRAAMRHALPPPSPEPGASRPAAPERAADSGGRSMLMLTLLTVVGGCLIAFGLLHFVSLTWSRKITTAIKRLEEARAAIIPATHDVSLPSHFRVVRAIGKGGMGVVYEAMDDALNRRVALKKMRDEIRVDPRERDRFLQEARTVAALHHPNIVDIYSIVEEGGELCLVFEHVSGRTVEQLLETKGRLSVPEARHLVRGICKALDYAHKRGVVHRDLKPSNIMLADDHDVKVMDFGIARHAKDALSRMTVTNTVAGTPPYMAPEADRGVVRPETDIYALGACLYEMLTGERPFPNGANTSAKLSMSFRRPTAVRRDLPPAIDALIEAALQPDPDKRIQTPGDFFVRFEQAASVPAA